jgi:hypothetical protein
MSKSQNQRVLDHMIDHGYITQVIAGNYGIRRLASRIHDLNGEGITVVSEIKKDDAGVRYATYSLEYPKFHKHRRDVVGLSYKLARSSAQSLAA